MKKILVPIEGKVTPKGVWEEIKSFEHVNKSPYSSTYYNMPGITWDYKPEGSLRVSDHWNFTSHEKKHCILDYTDELVQNHWLLARYLNGKYHVVKDFGENVPGYRYIELINSDLELLKELYNLGGIVSSKEWYVKHKVKPNLSQETHTKNRKELSKKIGKERLISFKNEKKDVKKVIYIEEKYLDSLKIALSLYDRCSELDSLVSNDEGVDNLINTHNAYKFKDEYKETYEQVYTVVLDNDLAVDYTQDEVEFI